MKRLFPLFFAIAVQAAEPWLFDVGGFLQFPIPAASSGNLSEDFTPIIGGGGDLHWWFTSKQGVGLKSSADYLCNMKSDIDLIELTQLAMFTYRFTFSPETFAAFGIEAGGTVHLLRNRGEWKTVDRSAPVAGGFVALPMRKGKRFIVGPHAESLVQFFRDEQNKRAPEWYIAVGVTAAFAHYGQ